MALYTVTVKEVWNQDYYVEAESEAEAIEKAREGDFYSEGPFEYNYSLDHEEWDIEYNGE